MRRLALFIVLVMTVSVAVSSRAAEAGTSDSSHRSVHRSFHPIVCPDGVFAAGVNVDCGYVRVPENRARPHGRTITVAAAVVHATSKHPAPDPIVFLDGGPSFGAISTFALDAYFAGTSFAADHDLVLVDTRGTGISTPNLACPELDEAEVTAFYSGSSINSDGLGIYREALHACRNRLTAQGIELAAYNSAESAADLEALRQALGVHQWNLLAASADGTLGLTYMRLFPHRIRSAIIDSGMSTQMLWGLDYDRGLSQELDSIFAGCAANASCNAAYPGIRNLFLTMVRRLQKDPVTITFPDYQPHPVQLVLDGVGLYLDALFSIFPGSKFEPSGIPDLLDVIWRETHGGLVDYYRDIFGTGPAENSHTNDFFAQGKTMSYVCHDMVDFITPKDLRQAARDIPPFAPRYLDPDYDLTDGLLFALSPAGCQVWDVGVAPSVQQHQPVSSRIPTLVLAGEYDIGVPPYVVRQVVRRLSHAHYFEFPATGHLQLASYTNSSECARAITTAFLAAPNLTPDSSCIATLPPTDFTPLTPHAAHAKFTARSAPQATRP